MTCEISHCRANQVLDGVREGKNYSAATISDALRVTGDIPNCETVHLWTPAGKWERGSMAVLAPAGPFDGLWSAQQ